MDLVDRLRANSPEHPTTDRIQAAFEIERLRAALQKIADIETRLGVPAGLDMQGIAKAALLQ